MCQLRFVAHTKLGSATTWCSCFARLCQRRVCWPAFSYTRARHLSFSQVAMQQLVAESAHIKPDFAMACCKFAECETAFWPLTVTQARCNWKDCELCTRGKSISATDNRLGTISRSVKMYFCSIDSGLSLHNAGACAGAPLRRHQVRGRTVFLGE